MSRHRSPGAQHQHAAAVRNGMVAAAVAGGSLALLVPVAAAATAPATADPTATLALAAANAVDAVVAGPGQPLAVLSSVEPVAGPQPDPTLDAAGLLKSVGLADVARRAEEERLAREAQALCDADLDGLGGVRPWVRDGARFLSCLYEQPDLIGVASRARQSDHPDGLAVDLMARGEQGDRIAECALANQEALGVAYVIFEQQANHGDGWEQMDDRGGDTANHYDHVHVSFERGAPAGIPSAVACS